MKPWVKIVIGLVLGIITGLVVGHKVDFLEKVGQAFIDLLKMLVGLIIFSSLVVGMCHISDPKKLGRIGLTTLLYYLVTTLIAIGFGLLLAFLIAPGKGLELPLPQRHEGVAPAFGIIDFLFATVPSNPFASFANGNVLQIIVFAVFFAFAINLAGEKAKPVLRVLESVSEVMYSLSHFVMKLAPYGVFALMATAISSVGLKVIYPLLKVLICSYIALTLQIIIVFCLTLKYLAKLKIAPFFKGMKDAIVVAFTTSSSSATLPVSLECARKHLGISADISGFVMSLGSTINMNGTSIGQVVFAVFIGQAYGIEMTGVKIGILVIISLVSAIGAAGVPGTGIIMLAIVLNAMGLPPEGIALVAGIDRLREMGSTVVNVMGDAVAAVFVSKKEKQIDEKKYHTATWLE